MPEVTADLVLAAGDVRLAISPTDGGRIRSLRVGPDELLVTSSPDGPIHWGAYPMAPWAGRIRAGQFRFRDRDVRLPVGLPPHAIHGIVFDRRWDVVDDRTLTVELGPPWPFRGRVTQRFDLTGDGLEVALELQADEAMPAVLGWHPWFRREIGGIAAELDFRPACMLSRDGDGLPTGAVVPPPAGPWDDAFTGLAAPPVLTWPGRLRLEIASTCPWWVVFDERSHAICVEPQSAPPDAVNLDGQAPEGIPLGPAIVEAGDVLTHAMTWRWTRP